MSDQFQFDIVFKSLTDNAPFPWQIALYERFRSGKCPRALDLPTGLGKTSVIAIWLIARANGANLPRRLVYVVNRRTVVDQTTDEVEKLRSKLDDCENLKDLRQCIGSLAISTLRGRFADNREWSSDPSRPAVICGTVDMIGSRLLFSGYQIGSKSRPLHAGFLGQDVLLVHDEAHLEPAFQKLIETIEKEQNSVERSGQLPWPKLRVMALSATTRHESTDRSSESSEDVFHLTTEDHRHEVVRQRIKATKNIALHEIASKDQKEKGRKVADIQKDLQNKILELALSFEDSGRAVLVFLRKVEDVEKLVRKLPARTTEQLTGTLRGLERDQLVKTRVFQRFLPKTSRDSNTAPAEGTVYLVCTSAGEVGVNISADHLVCDLSTFDSMAQRFGRVNRFGDCSDTRIHVVHPSSFGKRDKKGKVQVSALDQRRKKTLHLLHDLNGDGSPAAIGQLDPIKCREAFSPPPTILPATDILFDAWSLTTIRDKMPGRPPVEPYLHGISKSEPPQTQVAWRDDVEVFISEELRERYPLQKLLDDYPLKAHELLRDRSDRIFKHLKAIAGKHPESTVWLVGERGAVEVVRVDELAEKNNKDRISNCTILLPPSLGGLRGGLLNGKAEYAHDVDYDVADRWYEDKEQSVKRRIRFWDDGIPPENMALIRSIDTKFDADESDNFDGEDDTGASSSKRFWHWYVKPRDADNATRASAMPIKWDHHIRDVVQRMEEVVRALALPDNLRQALIIAAESHDLGKQREQWQRSIGNPNPDQWYAKPGKPVSGPRWRPRRISSYRHEYGSLIDLLDPKHDHHARFEQLDDAMKDIVLHVIAAHHGRARPHFPPDETYDPAPESDARAREQALETPRRFARLQRKYGRWGLAYLESLFRAADWAASAEPSPVEEDNA